MPHKTAFSFVPLDHRRSLSKPRRSGLTMVSDYQLGLKALEDLLDVAGDYIDIFKIATGTSRLFARDHLTAKISMLHAAGVRVLLGGQFQEYLIHTVGLDMLPRHLDEAREVGFDMIEISENLVDLGPGGMVTMLQAVTEAGLDPVGEIGTKDLKTDADSLVGDVRAVLEAGSVFAMIEGQELMRDNGEPNVELIEYLKRELDVDRCMFELPTPRVGSTTVDIYACKKALVKAFGRDVNLGNVTPDVVIETETTRLGLGSSGPLSLTKS